MSEGAHSTRIYQVVFGALFVALMASLLLAHYWGGAVMVVAIFMIAAVKAWLVASHFMHLKVEPRWIRIMLFSMLVALVALFVGVYIDVVIPFGGGVGS